MKVSHWETGKAERGRRREVSKGRKSEELLKKDAPPAVYGREGRIETHRNTAVAIFIATAVLSLKE